MNIVLSKHVLCSEDSNVHDHLTSLLSLLEQSMHALCLDEEINVWETHWFQGEGQRIQRRIRTLFHTLSSSSQNKDRLTLVISGQGASQLGALSMPLPDALKFLEAPVHIVVEFLKTDKDFVAELLRRFALDLMSDGDSNLKRQLHACLSRPSAQARPIQFVNGGGSTTAPVVEGLLTSQIPARVLAVVDGDARIEAKQNLGPDPDVAPRAKKTAAGQVPLPSGETGKAVFRLAATSCLRRYCLGRREQENYLPRAALEHLAELRSPGDMLLKVFLCLDSAAQNYWDMKDGLKSSLKAEVVKSLNAADRQAIDSRLKDVHTWKDTAEAAYWQEQATVALVPNGFLLADLYHGFGSKAGDCWSSPLIKGLEDTEFSEEVREEARAIAAKLRQLL